MSEREERLRFIRENWNGTGTDLDFLLSELSRAERERDGLAEHKQLLFAENGRLLAEKEAGLWDANHPVRKERDRLAEALEVAKKSLKWVSDEGYKVVPSHWREIAREQALDANRALREIERILGGDGKE